MIQKWLSRIILFPFSMLYGLGITIRNLLYDAGLLKSAEFNIPIIGVGNLSVGGAGKTPHVEYLIRLLQEYINVAILARGYKRKSKGFRFVNFRDTVFESGDEPIQYKRKYRQNVVAVSESRAVGIPIILQQFPQTQCIVLDDSFQHRAVTPGLNILLTDYGYPFVNDFLLPMGRLREWRKDYERADIIVVTKCPEDLVEEDIEIVRKQINPKEYQTLYFSKYQYLAPYLLLDGRQRIQLDQDMTIVLLCAIASTDYIVDYLEKKSKEVIAFKHEDHHYFTESDLDTLKQSFQKIENEKKIIITTEKDAVRLYEHRDFIQQNQLPVFVLPIHVSFINDNGTRFDKEIKNYLLNFKV